MPTVDITSTVINGEALAEYLEANYTNYSISDNHVSINDEGITLAELQGIISAHNPSTQSTSQSAQSVQSQITQLKTIAVANAPFIASLMASILSSDYDGDNLSTRWTAFISVMGSQSAGIQTRFKQAVIAEENINIDSIGVGNLTDANKRAILRFARRFASSWAIVVIS